jgi:hypothetical protein
MGRHQAVPAEQAASMGRSQGGLTSKIHAVVDTNGLPARSRLQRVRRTTSGSQANSYLA